MLTFFPNSLEILQLFMHPFSGTDKSFFPPCAAQFSVSRVRERESEGEREIESVHPSPHTQQRSVSAGVRDRQKGERGW